MNHTMGHNKRLRRRRKQSPRFTHMRMATAGMVILTGFLLMGAGKAIGSTLIKISANPLPEQAEISYSMEKHAPETLTEERQESKEASADIEDWRLRLVNPWNALPADYEVTLTQLSNGHAVDERCYPDLQAMMDACRTAGLSPVICSSYRTQEKQETLFNNKVNSLLAKGLTQTEAKTEAGKAVAVPGTSEHQLGLAVDIVDLSNQNLDESQENTAVQKWMMENSWKYGFILRYPNDKSDITGIIYEPWHYRYVGKEAAKEIYALGICLEEYLEQTKGNKKEL